MEGPVSKESDVYSFAMVLIEVRVCDHPNGDLTTHLHKVFTGRAPFYNSRPTTVAVDVLSGVRPERPAHSSLTDDLWDLTQRCLDHDPQQRPGVSEIVFRLRGNHNSQDGDDATWDGTTFGSLRRGESPPGKLSCISHDEVALDEFGRVVFPVIPVDGRAFQTSAGLEVREVSCVPPGSRKNCTGRH
jgi:serine/threonine protein kinase